MLPAAPAASSMEAAAHAVRLAARPELDAAERADPWGHGVHVALAALWGVLQSLTNAGEAISWGLLLAFAIARLPRTWRCYLPAIRDPLWWTLAAWAAWWAAAGFWGPEIPGRARDVLPQRWVLTPLMIWPVMARPWIVLGAMALGGLAQSVSILVLSWNGKGWTSYLDVRGLSSFWTAQWQVVIPLVLSAAVIRRGAMASRSAALVAATCAAAALWLLALRLMIAAAITAVAIALLRPPAGGRSTAARALVVAGVMGLVATAVLLWSPMGARFRASLDRAAVAMEAGNVEAALMSLSSHRFTLAQAAIDIGVDHPILGGGRHAFMVGLPQWALGRMARDPALSRSMSEVIAARLNDAHNAFLQAWVEGGIPAVLLLTAWMLLLARRLWRQSGWSPAAGVALALYALVLVNASGGVVTIKNPGALIAVCLAISWLGLGYRVAKPIT